MDSTPIYDGNGMALTKPPLVMDLGKINFPKSAVSSLAKGKRSQSSAMSPVIIAPAKPVPPPILEEVCSDISSSKVTPPPSPKAPLNPDPPLVPRPSWNEVVSAGKFLGNIPKLGFMTAILNKLWGRDGSISIAQYKEGLFLFQFHTEAAYNHALLLSLWFTPGGLNNVIIVIHGAMLRLLALRVLLSLKDLRHYTIILVQGLMTALWMELVALSQSILSLLLNLLK
ncbi:hypothetical protein Tsubulata_035426 [Turnera subulata]|uniref:DUF4283 domain-containing protein n=1 Tax=Turnera subulata TaxID=218843 RepID=A0A9Q0FT37_9ROSI|nr:hypothetical protein Tsubulata_035426 [Turnera subulata]